jgi:hypothetical protein
MSTIKKATTHPEPADLLQYLPLYNVVICSTCKYAIQPQAIARHLKEIHHIHRSHRRPYMQHVSKLSLNDAGTVIEAKIHEFPVPLLPVQDGLVCESEGCEHLCVSTKRMRTHWLDQHGRSGQAFLDWQPVKLQTFFRGNLLRYFTDPQASFVKGEKVPHCDLKSNPDGKIKVRCPNLLECNHALTKFAKDRAKGHHIPLSSIIKPSSYSWLNDSDAQLVNHYITSTSLSISTSITKQFWKIHAPYLAIQHPFLLHGFLALSALHLAHISQSNQPSFLISANTHQSLAMPLFRTAIANVTIANSEAILVFSHLLVLYSFASESQDERLFLTSSSISSFNIPVDKEDGSDILP